MTAAVVFGEVELAEYGRINLIWRILRPSRRESMAQRAILFRSAEKEKQTFLRSKNVYGEQPVIPTRSPLIRSGDRRPGGAASVWLRKPWRLATRPRRILLKRHPARWRGIGLDRP